MENQTPNLSEISGEEESPQAKTASAAKKKKLLNVFLGIAITIITAILAGLILKLFNIDIFRYISPHQLQELFQSIFGGSP